MEVSTKKELKKMSANIRLDILKMLEHVGYGHIGGSLSLVETMSVLYGKQLNVDPNNPNWIDRDMVVLSKGHCGPAWYSALAEAGFFNKEMLYTLNEGGTNLPSHPDRLKTPGVDMTTGSLGQGTSAAAGIAYGMKLNKSNQYVYLIVGDGEINEGQCWEAFEFISHYKLNNCIVLIDYNKRQLDGYTKDILNFYDLEKKFKSFGFWTKTVNGADEESIDAAIDEAKSINDQAVCIILDTIKGQGVKYYEEMFSNHSVKFNNDEIINENHIAIEKINKFLKEDENNV